MKIKDLVRKNIKELTPYSSARDEFKSTSDFIYLDANESSYAVSYTHLTLPTN